MHKRSRFLSSLFLAAALTFSVMGTACAHHYRVYDPYYSDYHVGITWRSVTTPVGSRQPPRRAPRLPQSAAWRTEGILGPGGTATAITTITRSRYVFHLYRQASV